MHHEPTKPDLVLDPVVLRELRELDPNDSDEILHSILRTFTQSSSELVRAMQQGRSDGDAERVWRAAHALKGSARTIGAVALGDACELLEQTGIDDPSAFEWLEREHARAMEAILVLLGSS